MEEIMLSQYSLPAILMVIMGVIYKLTTVPDKWKPLIVVGIGIGLSITAMFYRAEPVSAKAVIDYVLYGFMNVGAAAIGLYEVQRVVTKPRE